MIIIGVDPGTIFTGYGIIKFEKNICKAIDSGVINLGRTAALSDKLDVIYTELSTIIKKHSPDEFAIETAFYGKNVQSAMKIGYARGVSILAAVHNNVPLSEYSPREVKKSVVGNGAASKEQVFYMICRHLNLKEGKMKFDESDALAIAICHAFRVKTPSSKSRNWKQFAEAFPERILE